VEDDGEKIIFESYVLWSYNNEYDVSVSINKKNKSFSHNCECPAHTGYDWCKHIAAFARKIWNDYRINDYLEVTSTEDWTLQTWKGSQSNITDKDIYEKLSTNDDFLKEILTETMWIPVDWLPKEIFQQLKKEYLWELKNKLNIDDSELSPKWYESSTEGFGPLNKLSIFSKIENNISEEEKLENNLFKIKLDFVEVWYYNNKNFDIKLGVYKCKILKNWKLSAWTKVKKTSLYGSDVPKNIQKLELFLDEAWNYWNEGRPWVSFLDNPDYFLRNLFEFDEVFNSRNNNILKIDKNIYDLKISTKKTKDLNYEIKLVLDAKKWEIFFKNFTIIWEENNKNYACYRINWDVLFFKSDLGFDFIKELNSGDLVLNEEEFQELKSSDYFENIIKHSHKVENLWIEKIIWEPKWKIIIEIDEDFENVKVKTGYYYWNNNNIFLEDFGKKEFFVSHKIKGTTVSPHLASPEGEGEKESQRIIIERNKSEEKNIFKNLDNLKNISENITNFWFTKIVDENIDEFFDEIEKLIEKDFIVEYAQPTKRVSNNELWIKVNIKSGVDFFDTQTALTIWEKEVEECSELLYLIVKSKNKKSITLKNGMTILLKNDLTKSLDLLWEMWIAQKDIWKENIQISKHNIWLLKDKKLKWDLISFELDKETLKLKKSLTNFSGIRKIAIPENIKADLRDYQQTWYNWLNFLEKYNFSWILADDMWLWKTLQALALLQKLYNNSKLKQKSLVVCPTSLVFNWLDEAEKFAPDLKVEYIKDWKTAFTQIKKDTQIVIVSYWIIANLSEKGELKEKFHYLILDESQNIKNPQAKRTKSICKIVAKYRLALSWTPIENNLMELWSAFNFLMPWFLNNLNNFKWKYMSAKSDKETMKNLSAKVKPFILRRKKEDVLKELPEKVEEVIKLEMWAKQKDFYIKLKNAFKLQINKELEEQGLNKARFKVLDSLLKLRQACLTPQLINNDQKSITTESVKLDYIRNSIEEMLNNWHNLLIFSQFTGFLKYVREILEEKNIEYNYLDWQTKSKDRMWLVDEFNNWKKQVFIISLKAWGTGLNLTKADYVIHLDPWWNPAVENQATDRAHRMWQKKTVFVQKLICKDSIEEKILVLQEKKKKLIDDVFSWNFSWSLNKEDIDFIFE